jgi:hypothetical protein
LLFDLEFRELALLRSFQFLFTLCCVGMGQIGLLSFLRLPLQTVIPNNEDDATYIRLILTVCAAELGTDINLEIASVGRRGMFH